MNDKFGFKAATDTKTSDDQSAEDLSDFRPAEPHTPDPDAEAEMDQRAAEIGFPARSATEPDTSVSLKRARSRRRPPREPATQLTMHIPERVAERYINWCTDNNFRSYWAGLEFLMDEAGVPK